jgi:hypothetical protein
MKILLVILVYCTFKKGNHESCTLSCLFSGKG